MDNKIILDQFNEIERKVASLLDVNKSLEATNLELKNKISGLEGGLQAKIEAEEEYAKERDMIRSRIDGLLVKLEESAGV